MDSAPANIYWNCGATGRTLIWASLRWSSNQEGGQSWKVKDSGFWPPQGINGVTCWGFRWPNDLLNTQIPCIISVDLMISDWPTAWLIGHLTLKCKMLSMIESSMDTSMFANCINALLDLNHEQVKIVLSILQTEQRCKWNCIICSNMTTGVVIRSEINYAHIGYFLIAVG